MKKEISLLLVVCALTHPACTNAAEKAYGKVSEKQRLPKPSSAQIFKYVELVNKDYNINKKNAEDTLGKWISGNLYADNKLMKLINNKIHDSATCDVCVSKCFGSFEANPYCVAGCVSDSCK